MADIDAAAVLATHIPALHELSLEDLLRLDRSVLAESLLRVHEYVGIDDSENISRFNAAL